MTHYIWIIASIMTTLGENIMNSAPNMHSEAWVSAHNLHTIYCYIIRSCHATATCTGGVFLYIASRHLLMCTHDHILQLVLCGGGGCSYVVVFYA